MKKIIPILCSAIILALSSCGPVEKKKEQTLDIHEYNAIIIQAKDRIYQLSIDLSSTFEKRDSAEMYTALQAVQYGIDTSLADISVLSDFNGNTAFRDAASELFLFYESAMKNEYKGIIEILIIPDEEQTEAHGMKINELLEGVTVKEMELDEKFSSAQEKFARENGLSTKETEEL